MIPMHPQPLRDFDYKGFHYYSLTWCCDWRQPHFTQADRVELVRSNFLRASEETGVHLRDDEPRAAVRYVLENPLRAGLVTKVEDYPYTGSGIYSMAELLEFAYAI